MRLILRSRSQPESLCPLRRGQAISAQMMKRPIGGPLNKNFFTKPQMLLVRLFGQFKKRVFKILDKISDVCPALHQCFKFFCFLRLDLINAYFGKWHMISPVIIMISKLSAGIWYNIICRPIIALFLLFRTLARILNNMPACILAYKNP